MNSRDAVNDSYYRLDYVSIHVLQQVSHAVWCTSRLGDIVLYFSPMIRTAYRLPDVLFLLLVLVLVSPVPIASGISTLRVIPVLAALAIPVFILRKSLRVEKNILIFNYLYTLLVVLSFEAIALDGNYRLMYFSTLFVAYVLPLIKIRGLNEKTLIGATLIFFILVFMNAEILLTSAFSSGTRLDILNWQKESAFIYGINKFLMGVFTVSVLFAISDLKKAYKFIMVLLYVFLSIFYGSRSHALLGVILLIMNEVDIRSGNIGGYVNRAVKGGVAIIFSAFLVIYFIDYNIVLGRISNLVLDISSSNRWPIFEVFLSCLSEHAEIVGVNVLICTQEVTYDLDNSFAFVMASSGIAGFLTFCLLLLWSLHLLFKSKLDTKWVVYIIFAMFVILSVDILVYRPFILLPVLIYMLKTGGNKKYPIDYQACSKSAFGLTASRRQKNS